MNGDFYSSKCLREVEDFYKTRRPSTGARGIKLLHDNARPHVSKLTRQTIDEIGFEVLEHPPYTSFTMRLLAISRDEKTPWRETFFNKIRTGNRRLPLPT